MATEKQQEANQQNAQKSTGPKSEKGKEVVRLNAMKHGLLSKELVIREGDGKEDEGEFVALLQGLRESFSPEGTIEEMLVERIATCYWRLRRSIRYEAGILRVELDSALAEHKAIIKWDDEKVDILEDYDHLVENERRTIRANEHCIKMLKKGLELDREYEDKMGIDMWSYYSSLISTDYVSEDWTDPDLDENRFSDQELTLQEMREFVQKKRWDDKKLRENFINQDLNGIEDCKRRLKELEAMKRSAELEISRLIQTKALPESYVVQKLIRYEMAIERQLYRAMNQLERFQRQRMGEIVPPPINVEVSQET